MQTLKLIIPGSYYDSQIYAGRLYLWSNNGAIITLDWDRLIESINVSDRLKLALVCAFQKSEYLYGDKWQLIFQDAEIKGLIQHKFQDLAENPIEISQEELRRYYIREQNNPLSFPHADCTIYNKILYLGSRCGVSSTKCDHKNKYPISPKSAKIWDGPALSLAASYMTLAISAGDEGLFEYDLDDSYNNKPRLLIKQHSNYVKWLFASTFSSSYFNEGFLADFDNRKNNDDEGGMQQRILRAIVPADIIFDHQSQNSVPSFTWGAHDKICIATPESIEVVQYNPYKEDLRFVKMGAVSIKELPVGDIINGDSALFGYIVEYEDGLLVINSLMESLWLPGEPVNWRVFPKSKFYTNQMHIIYDDHLCIHSFNQDYFVDQKTKQVGIRHTQEFPFFRRSR